MRCSFCNNPYTQRCQAILCWLLAESRSTLWCSLRLWYTPYHHALIYQIQQPCQQHLVHVCLCVYHQTNSHLTLSHHQIFHGLASLNNTQPLRVLFGKTRLHYWCCIPSKSDADLAVTPNTKYSSSFNCVFLNSLQ